MYPDTPPEVSVQSGVLNRSSHEDINAELQKYMSTIESGSLYIGSIVEWVQEHFSNYIPSTEEIAISSAPAENNKRCRLWIHSHHIYSKTKMKNIEEWAKELNLTGFFLPGKPGFMCVEGLEKNCNMWWQRVWLNSTATIPPCF